MAHRRITVILAVFAVFSQLLLTCATNDKFVCGSQLKNTSQSNASTLVIHYNGISSHLVCGILCKNSPFSCISFHFTYFNVCYLYGNVTPAIATESMLTCQLVRNSPTIQTTARTELPTQAPSATSKPVIINGVSYPNLSCYPQKLFSGSSYSTDIPIGGGQANCKCEGGLYIEDGAYVNQSAITFSDCFSACAKIPQPPCKAFAFLEANNTCVIAPSSSSGDSTDKGVLHCYI